MSVYTTQLRYIVETGKPKLNLDNYPIFDESYRSELNTKIINHFFFREIGFETAGLFNNRLGVKMAEIMPYYNQLYLSALTDISPFINRKFTETFSRHLTEDKATTGSDTENMTNQAHNTTDNQGRGTRTNTEKLEGLTDVSGAGDRKEVGSDTPQGMLEAENVFDGTLYASSATIGQNKQTEQTIQHEDHTADETTTNLQAQIYNGEGSQETTRERSGSEKGSTWETFTRELSGMEGANQAELLLKFRETFLNIDLMIIGELEELFMQIW